MGNALALPARSPGLRVGTRCNRIGDCAIDVSRLLARIVVIATVIPLVLRRRGCALALALALRLGRCGSDGWRWTALRRVGHVAVAIGGVDGR